MNVLGMNIPICSDVETKSQVVKWFVQGHTAYKW